MLDTSAPATEPLEKALLAAVLTDNAALDATVDTVRADDFENPAHGELWQAACDLRREGRPVNIVTLHGLTGADPLGGQTPLDALRQFEFAANMPDANELADAIRDASLRRALVAQGEWLASQVNSGNAPPAELLTASLRELDGLMARAHGRRKTSFTFAEVADEALDALQSTERDDLIPTGLRDVDDAIGGLGRGRLVVLAGRSSMGKSAIGSQIATNAADHGFGVFVSSLEMSRLEWLFRIASSRTWAEGKPVPYTKANRRDLTDDEHERLAQALIGLQKQPAIIDDAGDLTVSDIAARTRRAATQMQQNGKRLSLVVVDHIGKVRPTDRYAGSKVNEVGEITGGLAALAKSENVAVLALSQLNRNPEHRSNRRPEMADLRDSGNVEQDADAIMLAFREAYYLEREKYPSNSADEDMRLDRLEKVKNNIELGIPKNRQGQICTVNLFCDMACNVIRDLEKKHDDC